MSARINGNTIYIQDIGSITTERVRVIGIIFTPAAANDSIEISETSDILTNKIKIKAGVTTTQFLDLQMAPIRFERGIYVQSITDGARCTLITSTEGSTGG